MSELDLERRQGTVNYNLYRSLRGKRKCSVMDHHHPDMWGWTERLGIGGKHLEEYNLKVLQGEHWLAILPPMEGGLTERRPPSMETRRRTCHRYLAGLHKIKWCLSWHFEQFFLQCLAMCFLLKQIKHRPSSLILDTRSSIVILFQFQHFSVGCLFFYYTNCSLLVQLWLIRKWQLDKHC